MVSQDNTQCTEKHVGQQMKNAWQSKSKFKALLIVLHNYMENYGLYYFA